MVSNLETSISRSILNHFGRFLAHWKARRDIYPAPTSHVGRADSADRQQRRYPGDGAAWKGGALVRRYDGEREHALSWWKDGGEGGQSSLHQVRWGDEREDGMGWVWRCALGGLPLPCPLTLSLSMSHARCAARARRTRLLHHGDAVDIRHRLRHGRGLYGPVPVSQQAQRPRRHPHHRAHAHGALRCTRVRGARCCGRREGVWMRQPPCSCSGRGWILCQSLQARGSPARCARAPKCADQTAAAPPRDMRWWLAVTSLYVLPPPPAQFVSGPVATQLPETVRLYVHAASAGLACMRFARALVRRVRGAAHILVLPPCTHAQFGAGPSNQLPAVVVPTPVSVSAPQST